MRYKVNCKICKRETMHIEYLISRKRGIRLRCFVCGNIKRHFINFSKLMEFEFKEDG